MLQSAVDPFAEVAEDDEGQNEQLIHKFLADLRDMDVLQEHQEKFKEKQQEREATGYKATLQHEKQHKDDKSDSEAEEEESKEPKNDAASD